MKTQVVFLIAFAAMGCQSLESPQSLPALDRVDFECRVQPVLAARCAYSACHGDPSRAFVIYARGRLRLDVAEESVLKAPLTDAERQANFDLARGFSVDERLDGPLLVMKPLDIEAGGLLHLATRAYRDEDVFMSTSDPGSEKLAAWLDGHTSNPGCTPTDEVGP